MTSGFNTFQKPHVQQRDESGSLLTQQNPPARQGESETSEPRQEAKITPVS